MTAYTLTPLGASGVDEKRAEVVHGPSLRDSLTRAELARSGGPAAGRERRAAGAQRLKERIEAESELRVRAQVRLHSVGAALARLVRAHPEVADAVESVRDEIWRLGGEYSTVEPAVSR